MNKSVLRIQFQRCKTFFAWSDETKKLQKFEVYQTKNSLDCELVELVPQGKKSF